jgi:hypothetical protein
LIIFLSFFSFNVLPILFHNFPPKRAGEYRPTSSYGENYEKRDEKEGENIKKKEERGQIKGELKLKAKFGKNEG